MLPWRVEIIANQIPRRILFNPPNPTPIYPDASGPGQIGADVFFDSSSRFARTHLQGWFAAVANIYEFELPGAIFGLTIAALCSPGRPCLICIDNSAASRGLVRGNCDSRWGRVLTSVFWLVATRCSAPAWIEQVRSEIIVADSPSRVCECVPDKSTLGSPNYAVPDEFRLIFAPGESLGRRQYRLSDGVGSCTERWPRPQGGCTEPQRIKWCIHGPTIW